MTQEVTFFRDCRPEKMTRYPTGGGGAAAAAAAAEAAAQGDSDGEDDTSEGGGAAVGRAGFGITSGKPGSKRKSGGKAGRGRGGGAASRAEVAPPPPPASGVPAASGAEARNRILRTVYLPSERADALLMTVQSLQQQLEDARRLHEERAQAWRQDRAEREETYKARAEADAAKIEALQNEVQTTRLKLTSMTKDYLQSRHNAQVATRSLSEEVAVLQANSNKLREEAENTKRNAAAEMRAVRQAAEAESDSLVAHTRLQSRQREDDLAMLKEQYGACLAKLGSAMLLRALTRSFLCPQLKCRRCTRHASRRWRRGCESCGVATATWSGAGTSSLRDTPRWVTSGRTRSVSSSSSLLRLCHQQDIGQLRRMVRRLETLLVAADAGARPFVAEPIASGGSASVREPSDGGKENGRRGPAKAAPKSKVKGKGRRAAKRGGGVFGFRAGKSAAKRPPRNPVVARPLARSAEAWPEPEVEAEEDAADLHEEEGAQRVREVDGPEADVARSGGRGTGARAGAEPRFVDDDDDGSDYSGEGAGRWRPGTAAERGGVDADWDSTPRAPSSDGGEAERERTAVSHELQDEVEYLRARVAQMEGQVAGLRGQ